MAMEQERWVRAIINGKAATDPLLRPAIEQIRASGTRLDVRVTWEAGDATRFASEAADAGVDRVVAIGGDGTVNEVASGLLEGRDSSPSAMAVVPYGTANDFATGIGILREDPLHSLRHAVQGKPTLIDVGTVNKRVFVNVTSGGFGAEVTANTPPQMKKVLGGAAYSLMGIVTAAKMNPHDCHITGPDGETHSGKLLLLAVGNGRQCGGGFHVTPEAILNDGLLDIFIVHDAELAQFGIVLNELMNMSAEGNQFVAYKRLPSFTLDAARPMQLNLDGEPYVDTHFEFEVLSKALPFILGPEAPVA